MPEECPALSEVLSEVKNELRTRFTSSNFEKRRSTKSEDKVIGLTTSGPSVSSNLEPSHTRINWGESPQVFLDSLEDEDWNSIIYPVSELRPYLNCVVPSKDSAKHSDLRDFSHHLLVLKNYVQCRCAELPMRVQTEALILRRHEEVHRQYMRQLILLTQFLTFSLAPLDLPEASEESAAMKKRIQQCLERIPKMEEKILQEAAAKRKCCQRMILMSAVVYALVDRLEEYEEADCKESKTRQRRLE